MDYTSIALKLKDIETEKLTANRKTPIYGAAFGFFLTLTLCVILLLSNPSDSKLDAIVTLIWVSSLIAAGSFFVMFWPDRFFMRRTKKYMLELEGDDGFLWQLNFLIFEAIKIEPEKWNYTDFSDAMIASYHKKKIEPEIYAEAISAAKSRLAFNAATKSIVFSPLQEEAED